MLSRSPSSIGKRIQMFQRVLFGRVVYSDRGVGYEDPWEGYMDWDVYGLEDIEDARRREEAVASEGNVTKNYMDWLTRVRLSFSP